MDCKVKSSSGALITTKISFNRAEENIVRAFFHNIVSGDFAVLATCDGKLSIFFEKEEDAMLIKLKDCLFDDLKMYLNKTAFCVDTPAIDSATYNGSTWISSSGISTTINTGV